MVDWVLRFLNRVCSVYQVYQVYYPVAVYPGLSKIIQDGPGLSRFI